MISQQYKMSWTIIDQRTNHHTCCLFPKCIEFGIFKKTKVIENNSTKSIENKQPNKYLILLREIRVFRESHINRSLSKSHDEQRIISRI